MNKEALSPMMQQYMEIKSRYEKDLLFFRLGDFYELFFEDALEASKILDIALTSRDCGLEERAPMCGVPFHSADNYIDRLILADRTVAICEQLEEPQPGKIVMRDVVRVITPGTITDSNALLDSKKNNFLASVYRDGDDIGLAFTDITTGELFATRFPGKNSLYKLISELTRYNPAEIITNDYLDEIKGRMKVAVAKTLHESYDTNAIITSQFGENPLENSPTAAHAVCALLKYLSRTSMCSVPQICEICYYEEDHFMNLDCSTMRNLELTQSMKDAKKRGTLLWALDKTKTSMGGRKLKSWITRPLLNLIEIESRQKAVDDLLKNTLLRVQLREILDKIQDLERLSSKVAAGTANARDMYAIVSSITVLPDLHKAISQFDSRKLKKFAENFDPLIDLHDLISKALMENPPLAIKEGGIINDGFDKQVDDFRAAMNDGTLWIAKMEQEERVATGIKNLKIGYNKVAGYYIEVSNSGIKNVPDTYARRQTLTNCERYVTGKLKEIENTIVGARERCCNLEYQLFCELRSNVALASSRIAKVSQIIAEIDVLSTFAEVSVQNNYVMPRVTTGYNLNIKDGRHPVVEAVAKDTLFVPNDAALAESAYVSIITGPNMAGKSTYMRQVALITLMAQIGCFVPASSAEIGIVDKIFTRVGATDDLSSGQSTFMMEMNEVANILNNATSKSLLILDEIGRGTSTYDGLSIAWAVVEHIANKMGAKTLFATHYHELTELEGKIPNVSNYCIVAKKRGDDIIFLRKIVRGGADDSYGIEVAQLAGVKREVIKRAKEIVATLENNSPSRRSEDRSPKDLAPQLDLFSSELLDEIKRLDITTITPLEALNILSEWSNTYG